MVKDDLSRLVTEAVEEAKRQGWLPPVAMPDTVIERPQRPEYGDYASSVPLKLARSARMNPMSIASIIVQLLPRVDYLEKIEVAAPGFINFTLKDAWLARQVDVIREAGPEFGRVDLGRGQRVQVEFVSANPTGPLHMGHGRGAVLGSTLANVLSFAGYDVVREYYINDAGAQMDAFFRTLWARYNQELGRDMPLPPDGYAGTYMVDLARQMVAEEGDRFLFLPEAQAREELGWLGVNKMLEQIREDLERISVYFDVWFSERTLYTNSQFERAMAILRERGYIEEREGAVWFSSTALGEDKDNVIIRSSGLPTYFASDIAYHYHKFVERGFDRVINIWGADHQGHVPRMKAVIAALGIDPDRLQIVLTQLVTLRRGGEIVRLSKRTGDIITLREVIDEVGPDAVRFFFLMRSADSQMDFDLELAKQQSNENPVYYVQYAHARIVSILRLAEERGIVWQDGDVNLLRTPFEMALIRKMLQLPEVVELAAQNLEPHHLSHYALDLAAIFHTFYRECRVISDDAALTAARLKLVEAVRNVLANTLGLMAVSAPERM